MANKKRRKQRRLNKGNLIILMVIAIAILGLIGAGTAYLLNLGQPSFLKSGNARSAEVVKDKTSDVQIAVYYPKSESNAGWQSLAESQAQALLDQLKAETADFNKAKKPLLVKADYQLILTQERYASVLYTIQKNDGGVIQESAKTYLVDLQSNQLIDPASVFDQDALEWIAARFRADMKAQEATREEAYGMPFIQASAANSGNYTSFSLEEGVLHFFFPAGTMLSQDIRWDMPVSELGEHFLLDVGQGTLDVNKVRIPPRVIDPNKPMVCLTFDDGPHPVNTPEILNILKNYDSAATFFMQGFRVERYPETTLNIINSGSEAASHSFNHPKLTKLKDDDLNYQLNRTTELVQELTDWQYTIRLFRPPYGAVNDKVKAASAYPLVMWNIDTLDWKTRDPEQTHANVMNEVKDGDIILMHDIHAETVEAVQRIVPDLIAQGYQLVTVDEMLEAKGLTANNGQRVFSSRSIKD